MTAHSRRTATWRRGLLAGILTCILTVVVTGVLALPALAVQDDPVLKHMDAVLEENARLHDEAWKAHKSHDREAAQRAEEALAASEERVEKARTEALAHVAGISPAQVEALRKDGRSWGQAAGELGVHPGFLGVGKTPLYESLPKHSSAKAEGDAPAKGKRGKKKAEAPQAAAKARRGKKDLAGTAPKAKAKVQTKAQAKAAPEKKARKQKRPT